jgi:hypothetical protein
VTILILVKNQKFAISVLTLFVMLVSATYAFAIVCPGAGGDFTVSSGTTAGTQTLDGGDTGTVEQGGTIAPPLDQNGVDITCDNNTVNNHGSIATMGNRALGIFGDHSVNNIINNYGSIKTMGIFGFGIYFEVGSSNSVSNYGSITTNGEKGFGIYLEGGSSNLVNNYGSITTKGKEAHGIEVEGLGNGSNSVSNYGSITTKGKEAHGVHVDTFRSNTINNYGGIFVTDSGSFAIWDQGGMDNTLNIFPGSQIIGAINFNQAGDVINIFGNGGAGSSSTLTFLTAGGFPIVNLKGDNMVNVGGPTGIYAVVDPTGPSVNGAALGSMMGGLHNVITQQLSHGNAKPAQVASTRVEPGMMPSADDSQIWFSGFGSHRERDTDGSVLAYDHDFYGGVGGYEMRLGRSSRIGFMAGYANTDLATDFQSLYTNTHSGFIGTYGQVRLGSFNLDGSLIGGYEQNDNNRIVVDNINGFELAEADYDSFFISPSVTLSSEVRVFTNIALRPSATATYSVAWYDDYTETGTTQSNLTIDDRTAQAVVTKLQMVAAYVFDNGSEVGLLAGGRFRYTINDDVNATLAGTSFRYASSGDDTHFEALVGAHARVAVMDNLNLTINTQYALNNGVETNFSGQAGVEFLF